MHSHNRQYNRTIEIILSAMVLLIPLAIYTGTADAIRIKQVIFCSGAAALGAVWLVMAVRQKKVPIIKSPLTLPIICYAIWNIAVLLLSPYKYAGISQTLQLLGCIAIYITVVTGMEDDKSIGRILDIALAGAFITCIYGMLQRFGIDFIEWDRSRLLSSLGNPTYFAAYIAMLIPVAVNRCLYEDNTPKRLALAGLVGLMSLCLILTYTRAAWIGEALALVIYVGLLLGNARRDGAAGKTILKRAALLIILIALVTVAAVRTASSAMNIEERLASSVSTTQEGNAQRIIIWKGAIGIIRDHLLTGAGPGNFKTYYPLYQDKKAYLSGIGQITDHAHNELLEITAETGIIGLAIYLWLLAAIIVLSIGVLKGPDSRKRGLAAALLCGLIAFMIQNMTGVTMRKASGMLFFWLFISLTAYLQAGEVQKKEEKAEVKEAFRPASAKKAGKRQAQRPKHTPRAAYHTPYMSIALAAALITLYPSSRDFKADIHLKNGNMLVDAGNYREVIEELQKAVDLQPYSLGAYYKLGHAANMLGRYDQALQSYTRLEELSPGYARTRYNLGAVLSNMGRYREAAALYRKSLQHEDNPATHIALAEALAAEGKITEAGKEADTALSSALREKAGKETTADIYLRRGTLNYDRNKLMQAAADFQQAVKLQPDNATACYQLGNSYRRTGQKIKAAQAYEMAVALDPKDSRANTNLGVIYAEMGQTVKAAGAYQAAIKANPEDQFARFNLAMLYIRERRTKEAEEELQIIAKEKSPVGEQAKAILNSLGE